MGDEEKKVKTEKQNSAEKKTKAGKNKEITSEEKKESLTEKVSENQAEENKEVSTDTEAADVKENIKAEKTDEPVSNSEQPDVEEHKTENADKLVSDAEQSVTEDVKEENADKSASDTAEPVACAEEPADEANQISELETKAEPEETAAVVADVKENIQDPHEPEVKPLSVPSENIEKSKSENDPFEHTVSVVECFIITFITALLAMLASGLVLRTQFVSMEKRFEKMEESITVQQAQINALQDRVQELENEKAAAESSVDGWFEEFGNWIEQFGGSGQIIENPDKDTIANSENLTDRGYLGVSVSDSEKGVVVRELLIEPSEFKEGDIILSIDGKDTATVQEILDLLETKKAGRTVKVVVERNNKKEEIKMTLLDKDSVQKKVDEKQMFDKDQESPKF